MKEETRQRAHSALIRCLMPGDYLFPKVYVCAEKIYFTLHAAYLEAREQLYINNKKCPIEVVSVMEAYGVEDVDTMNRVSVVRWKENQDGCEIIDERVEMYAWLKHNGLYKPNK